MALLPLLIVGSLSYYISTNSIQNKVEEGNLQILLQTQTRMEDYMKSIEYSVMQFSSAPDLIGILNNNLQIDDYGVINDLKKRMYSLQIHVSVRDALLMNRDRNWVIGNLGLYKYDEMTRTDQELYASYMNAERILFWKTEPMKGNGNEKIRIVNKLPFLGAFEYPKGLLVIDIESHEINRLILQNNRLGEVYVFDPQLQLILGQGKFAAADSVKFQERVAAGLNKREESTGHFKVDIDDALYWVDFRKSLANGWIYVSIQNIGMVTKDAKMIGWITLIGCLAVFAVSLLFAIVGSRRLHQPIGNLYRFVRQLSDKSEQARADEIGYIEEKIRHMAHSKEKLSGRMKLDALQLKEFFVTRLLLSQLNDNEIQEKLEYLGLPQSWGRLYVMVSQIDSLEQSRFRPEDKDLLLFAINNMVNEMISPDYYFMGLIFNDTQFTLLVDNSATLEESQRQVSAIANSVKESVHRYLHLSISVGISRPFHHLKEARNAYDEGIAALNSRFHLGTDMVLRFNDLYHESRVLNYPVEQEQAIIRTVRLLERERLEPGLRSFIAAVQAQNLTFNEFQLAMLKLMSRIMDVLVEERMSIADVYGDQPLTEQFQRLKSAEDFERWIGESLLLPLMEHMENNRATQFKRVVENMIEMIHQEYNLNLTLEECAARLNYHPVYLSRILKKETGYSFSEYLAQYRMSLAKRWLEDTSMNIAEIAKRLNYANSSTFIRYFSKSEGITPGQYRKENGKQP